MCLHYGHIACNGGRKSGIRQLFLKVLPISEGGREGFGCGR